MSLQKSSGWFRVRMDLFTHNLGAKEIAVYTYLAYLCHYGGNCVVRHIRIAEQTGLSTTSVKRALKKLKDENLIGVAPRGRGANRYHINWKPKSSTYKKRQDPPPLERSTEDEQESQRKYNELLKQLQEGRKTAAASLEPEDQQHNEN